MIDPHIQRYCALGKAESQGTGSTTARLYGIGMQRSSPAPPSAERSFDRPASRPGSPSWGAFFVRTSS